MDGTNESVCMYPGYIATHLWRHQCATQYIYMDGAIQLCHPVYIHGWNYTIVPPSIYTWMELYNCAAQYVYMDGTIQLCHPVYIHGWNYTIQFVWCPCIIVLVSEKSTQELQANWHKEEQEENGRDSELFPFTLWYRKAYYLYTSWYASKSSETNYTEHMS